MKKILLFFPIFIFLFFFSCKQKVSTEKIITVTIDPQRYFAEQLADSFFKIETMVPAGTSPETYDPSPVQVARLAQSTAYFCIGKIGFEEAWMDKIKANNPQLIIFDNSKGVEFIKSDDDHDHTGHDHGHHEQAHAGGVDPHIWNSPKSAKIIAANMCQALIELDPEHEAVYKSNLLKLEQEIDRTDSIASALFAKSPNKSFIIYHPALAYLARDYGLDQYSIEINGKEPSPEQLKQLVEASRENNIKTIFIQQEFDQKNAEIIARETGCRLVVINPLSYNWSEEIIHTAKALSGE